jgi:hypothetical protein
MTDIEIRKKWLIATRLYEKHSSLAKRISMLYVDELEAADVTEADIDRLFPLTPTQAWLRYEYVEASTA